MIATKRDMWGDLRAAAQRRDLSGLDLSTALDSDQDKYREYLCGLPAEVLATGARWDVEEWDDSLEGEHTLTVCGIEWWSGETWEHGQRWSLRERRRVLPHFEREHPDDNRPRRAIGALERYLDDRTDENKRARDAAWDAAWDAASSAARDAAWAEAWSAAGTAAFDAASAAAWSAAWAGARDATGSAAAAAAAAAAWSAAESAAWDMAWEAAWSATRAEQERDWMLYMLQEVAR